MNMLYARRLSRIVFAVMLLFMATFVWARPALAQAPVTYTVQRGDTLDAIARAHNTTVEAIVAANNIRDANLIFVGQRLTIPTSGVTVTGAAAAAQVTPPITIDQPVAAQRVASPISVRGKAVSPDGRVQVRLLDATGQILAEGSAWSGVGATLPFSLTLHYAVLNEQAGVLEAYRRDQTTLQARDVMTVPVTLVAQQMMEVPPAIVVSHPISSQQITSPLTVHGEANTTNGLVFVRLWDGANQVIARAVAWVGRGRGPQPFTVALHFVSPITQRATLEVYQTGLSATSKVDSQFVPLVLEEQARPAEPPSGQGSGGAPLIGVGCPRTHVVQRGENLFRIALRYDVTVEAIARASNITNVSVISVGQRLTIPCPGG